MTQSAPHISAIPPAGDPALQELEFAKASHVNELGQVTTAFAHELNQPLAAMQNYLTAARRLIEQSSTSPKLAEMIVKADAQLARVHETIRRIRGHAPKSAATPGRESVAAIFDELTRLIARDPRYANIVVSCEGAGDVPDVEVDRAQIQQVLMNLVRNALDAMEAMPVRQLSLSARPKDALVEIAVADSGPGLAPEVAARLFQPFVTTKPGSMGVGLSICRAIVESHGGHMRAFARDGGGTVFAFTVPAAS
jgi:two-component system sensor kinase FixL